jgi:DNA-binding Xre family transcriptional regulator
MMSEKIKLVMVKRNLNGKDLAEALGCSSQNVYNLLKKDNWNEEQIRKIGDKLNCDVEINFILRDTQEKF